MQFCEDIAASPHVVTWWQIQPWFSLFFLQVSWIILASGLLGWKNTYKFFHMFPVPNTIVNCDNMLSLKFLAGTPHLHRHESWVMSVWWSFGRKGPCLSHLGAPRTWKFGDCIWNKSTLPNSRPLYANSIQFTTSVILNNFDISAHHNSEQHRSSFEVHTALFTRLKS